MFVKNCVQTRVLSPEMWLRVHGQNAVWATCCLLSLFSQIRVSPVTSGLGVCLPACCPLALRWSFVAPSYVCSKNKTSVTGSHAASLPKAARARR